MLINADGNWVNILNDAVITYNNNIHSTNNMTPVDVSNNKVRYSFNFKNIKGKPGKELFNVNEVLKTQPPTYKTEDMKGEILEGKYYEQELFQSEFDFESNIKVLK